MKTAARFPECGPDGILLDIFIHKWYIIVYLRLAGRNQICV